MTSTPPDQTPPTPAPGSLKLADLTTTRVGGPIADYVEAHDEATLIKAVSEADDAGIEVLLVGGGSNLLASDEPFAGRVVAVRNRGIEIEDEEGCAGAVVHVAAGDSWDDFVALAVEREWIGIEALAGIPGLVGGAPVQNVGAYGQEVSHTIMRVRAFDRREQQVRTFAASECEFGYRSSLFKRERGRWVVLSVSFQFKLGDLGAPIGYGQLAQHLAVEIGDRAPSSQVRRAVLELRGSKGMVLDQADHDTWSTGSFFVNPVVPTTMAPAGAPSFAHGAPEEQMVKIPAAWLIEHAGFPKGFPGEGPATLSTKHTLALTNRGTARAADVIELARTIRVGVAAKFGINLEPEPVLVGFKL